MKNKVIVGTRTSKLALFQTNKVIFELKKNLRNIEFEIKEVKTKGDILLNQTLDRNLDKGFFVKEIQQLIIEEKIDIAVHSLKDLPVENDDRLKISAILKRGNPQDVFLSKNKEKLNLFDKNKVIGTTSLRRKAQLLKINPNLTVKDIRGNVDTRINKMLKGEFDALVMAAAGIERLNLDHHITEYFNHDKFLNAPGQGAIAVEHSKNNDRIKEIVKQINHSKSMLCVNHERNFMKTMGGGCNYPIGAYSYFDGDILYLEGIVLSLDGKDYIKDRVSTKNFNDDLSKELSDKFFKKNVIQIINRINSEISK
tara:strand:+ start:3288 stop:4220 length:933 start_codon:yes stop_codon:yes gene_type:complete